MVTIHQNKHSLLYNKNLHKLILESTHDLVTLVDLQGNFLYVNPSHLKVLGYKKDEMLSMNAFSLVHPAHIEEAQKQFMKTIKYGSSAITIQYLHKNGEYLTLEGTGTLVTDSQGVPQMIVTVFRDITERKNNDINTKFLADVSKIVASSLNNNITLKKISNIAVPHMADCCIIYIYDNERLVVSSISYNKLKKDKFTEKMLRDMPKRVEDTFNIFKVMNSDKSLIIPELTKLKKNLFPKMSINSFMCVPLRIRKKVFGVFVFFTLDGGRNYNKSDLTTAEEVARRTALAIENSRLYSDSLAAITLRDDFISIASHELKTPVTSIKAYTQVLQKRFEKSGDSASADLLNKMDAQLTKLTTLISDLLDINKIEKGKLLFRKSKFDLNDLIYEITEEVQRTTNNHRLITRLDETKEVFADRDRIGQVIINFMTNAIKYSPNGGDVIIKTKTSRTSFTFSVQDFGIGISKNNQNKIFDRFYREKGRTTDTYGGMGLGLYISSEIIKRHKGKIWVESKKDEGSEFFFKLPLR